MSNNLIEFDLGFVDAVVIGGGDDDGSYDNGYEVGKAEGLEEGKTIGYADGFSKGEEAGFNRGYADGKEDGLMEGEDIGYNKGYDDGEAFGKENAPTEDLSVTLTSNGTYSYEKPQDKYYADVEVVVNVPSKETPTQEKSLEVTENKVYEVIPDDGFALSKVTVTGNVASAGGGSGDDSGQLVKITTLSADEWDVGASTTTYFTNLIKTLDFTEFNKLKRTSFNMFFSSYKGTILDVSTLDVSNANVFDSMFVSCDRVKSLDLSSWDTSKATSFYQMFSGCSYLETVDLSSFNTENVKDFYQMFSNCGFLTTLDLSHFNTSKATNVKQMFYNCSSLKSLNLSGWTLENVTDLSNMFTSCSKLTSLDLSSINTHQVTSMSSLFYNCNALVNLTLSEDWAYNSKLTSLDIAQSPLSKASILDLANKIADKSDTSVYTGTYTVRLKSSQKSLFTEEEITALANQFTSKNWTLSW